MTAVAAGVVRENSFSKKAVMTQKYPKNHLSDCLNCINKQQTKTFDFCQHVVYVTDGSRDFKMMLLPRTQSFSALS